MTLDLNTISIHFNIMTNLCYKKPTIERKNKNENETKKNPQ